MIIDEAVVVATQTIDPVQLAALNKAWMDNAYQLGIFCFVVGVIVGVAIMYARIRYGRSQ